MSSPWWLYIGAGGSLGALMRFAVARWAGNRFEGIFPWGTLLVNLSGAFLLGALQGHGAPEPWLLFFGTGILGGMTTFSTWMLESVRLVEEGEYRAAAVNLLGTTAAGMALYMTGFILTGGHLW